MENKPAPPPKLGGIAVAEDTCEYLLQKSSSILVAKHLYKLHDPGTDFVIVSKKDHKGYAEQFGELVKECLDNWLESKEKEKKITWKTRLFNLIEMVYQSQFGGFCYDSTPLTTMSTCEIPDTIKTNFRKFKLSKNQTNRAYLLKINQKTLTVEEAGIIEDINDLTEFAEEHLPESEPRYLAFSTKQTFPDGRVSFPLLFIFYCPPSSMTLNSLYASTKQRVINTLEILKIFECRDREEFTNEWMESLLATK